MFSDRDYARYRRPYRVPRQETSMLKSLIIVNIAIFVLQSLFGPPFTNLILLNSDRLVNFELWRLGTHMFAHGNLTHIMFNMWGLYIFGKPLEMRVGGNRFLHIYFISGLIGAVAWLAFNWGSPGGMLGASGAVFGIMAAAAFTFPNLQYMLLIPPIPMKLKTMAVVFGSIEVLMLLSQAGAHRGSGVAHLAHLGGMLGGFIYMRWFFPKGGGQYGGRRGSLWENFKRTVRRFFLTRKFTVKHPPNKDADYGNDDFSPSDVDHILDKIGEQGLSSLTPRERHILEKARERFKGKH